MGEQPQQLQPHPRTAENLHLTLNQNQVQWNLLNPSPGQNECPENEHAHRRKLWQTSTTQKVDNESNLLAPIDNTVTNQRSDHRDVLSKCPSLYVPCTSAGDHSLSPRVHSDRSAVSGGAVLGKSNSSGEQPQRLLDRFLRRRPAPSLPSSPRVGERPATAAVAAPAALSRPTRHVYKVDSVNLEGYVRLNQYKLTGEIGQGSYGIVKLAYNEEDNNHYAMKILDKRKLMKKFAFFKKPPNRKNKPSSANLPDPLAQVQREIAILKKLSHPHVVKLVEVLDDSNDNYLYMVFEFVERGCVLEIPTTEPLPENLAWSYFRDTLMGLEYLHFHKIVHRDIKPSNLLLTESGRVKIADFGVSSEFEGLDALLTGTAGTPAFMAPEALIEDSSHFYSGRAQDIWSLGITLYSFVFGQVPFWDAFVIALHKKIKTASLTFPEKPVIDAKLKDLIEKLLNKNPNDRITLFKIKVHPWVSKNGQAPLPSEEQNCQLVTVTDDDIRNSVKNVPRLDTLILIKAMGHRRHFCNPFRITIEGTMRLRSKVMKDDNRFFNRCSSMTNEVDEPHRHQELFAACSKMKLSDAGDTTKANATQCDFPKTLER